MVKVFRRDKISIRVGMGEWVLLLLAGLLISVSLAISITYWQHFCSITIRVADTFTKKVTDMESATPFHHQLVGL